MPNLANGRAVITPSANPAKILSGKAAKAKRVGGGKEGFSGVSSSETRTPNVNKSPGKHPRFSFKARSIIANATGVREGQHFPPGSGKKGLEALKAASFTNGGGTAVAEATANGLSDIPSVPQAQDGSSHIVQPETNRSVQDATVQHSERDGSRGDGGGVSNDQQSVPGDGSNRPDSQPSAPDRTTVTSNQTPTPADAAREQALRASLSRYQSRIDMANSLPEDQRAQQLVNVLQSTVEATRNNLAELTYLAAQRPEINDAMELLAQNDDAFRQQLEAFRAGTSAQPDAQQAPADTSHDGSSAPDQQPLQADPPPEKNLRQQEAERKRGELQGQLDLLRQARSRKDDGTYAQLVGRFGDEGTLEHQIADAEFRMKSDKDIAEAAVNKLADAMNSMAAGEEARTGNGMKPKAYLKATKGVRALQEYITTHQNDPAVIERAIQIARSPLENTDRATLQMIGRMEQYDIPKPWTLVRLRKNKAKLREIKNGIIDNQVSALTLNRLDTAGSAAYDMLQRQYKKRHPIRNWIIILLANISMQFLKTMLPPDIANKI